MRRRQIPTQNSAVWLWLLLALISCRGEERQLSELEQLQANLPVQEGMNVIVISFDALRADVLGAYGYPLRTSPAIDALAGESIVFDNAYTVAPVTPTSFASAFTGLLPHRVFHDWDLVYTDTLARRFSDAGYSTAAFLNNVQLNTERHFDTGFDTYHYGTGREEEILEKALAWLGENRREKLFAWVHFISPHSPYDHRELAAHLYDESYEGEFERTTGGKFDTEKPEHVARIRSLYDGEVFYADTLFDQLIAGLRERELLDSSAVVVTSDHGEEFKEHGGFQHDRLTEEHVRVPLIIRHPAVRAPLRSKILTSNVDLFPTLLSLVGIEFERSVDGRDLTRISEQPDWIAGVSMLGARNRWLSMRRGRHKLIRMCMPEQEQQLFDLVADPGETRNLHQEMPGVTRELYRDLGRVLGGEPCPAMQAAMQGKGPTVGLSQENIEALKALGYLGD